MLDVLLLNPSTISGERVLRTERCQAKYMEGLGLWPPINLAELAAVLVRDGFRVKILDATILDLGFDTMIEKIVEMEPSLLVVQSTTPTIEDDKVLARRVKEHLAKTRVAFTGLHVTVLPQDALGKSVDFAIRGEADYTLLDLARKIRTGKTDFGEVKGLSFYSAGRIISNPPREAIRDLDNLPIAARHLLDNRKYKIPQTGDVFTIIKTSRGCPFQCIFCTTISYSGSNWRTMSPERVVREIKSVIRDYGIRDFFFLSDTFNIKKEFCMELCNLILREGLDIKWMCNSRTDTIDDEQAQIMARSGCWVVSLGIESGSDLILKNVRKGATTKDAEECVSIFRSTGIKTIGYFMFGLPGETRDTIEETIRFAKRLDPDYAYFFVATPFPGTDFFNMAEREGWLQSKEWRRYFHGFSDVIAYPGLSSEDISSAVSRAYKAFYMRPRKMMQIALASNPKALVKSITSFLRTIPIFSRIP